MSATTTYANPAKSPPLALPLSLISVGVLSLLLLQPLLILKAPMIFADFRFNAATLTAVHMFTLGWATAVMMGAFYQLAPVILLSDAPDWRHAAVEGVLFVVGSAVLICGFYESMSILIITGGSLVVLAVGLFVWLMIKAMRSSKAWNITGTYMILGLTFLMGTVLWGLVLAFNFRYAFFTDTLNHSPVGAHLVLGMGGWFMLTILGVSYQLIPMFTLSHRTDDRLATTVLWLITGGLWSAFGALVFQAPAAITAVALATVLAGVVLYGYDMVLILKRRRRANLDLGMRYALTSLGFLGLTILLSVLTFSGLVPALQQNPGPAAVIWFGFFGFVAMMIMGMLYKIVPFLIWHQRFRHRNGRPGPLPTLNEMYTEKLAVAGYWFWVSGLLVTGGILLAGAVGLATFPGAIAQWTLPLTAVASLLFAWTLAEVVRA